jgi:hypothetical protein
MGGVLVLFFRFGFICWRTSKHFCQYTVYGVASGIVGLYVIVNLGIGVAFVVESPCPPSSVHTCAEHSLWILYVMLLGQGHCSGSASTFIRLCLHMLIYISLDV